MDKKRKMMMILPLMVVGVAIILMAYLFIFQTAKLDNSSFVMTKVYNGFAITALIASLFYIVTGFQKSSAKYFKLFLYTYVLSSLTHVLSMAILPIELSNHRLLRLGLKIIVFILLSILMLKNDLGKKLSSIIASFILIVSIVYWGDAIVIMEAQARPVFLIANFSEVALATTLAIMERLKYYDKKQRNTQ